MHVNLSCTILISIKFHYKISTFNHFSKKKICISYKLNQYYKITQNASYSRLYSRNIIVIISDTKVCITLFLQPQEILFHFYFAQSYLDNVLYVDTSLHLIILSSATKEELFSRLNVLEIKQGLLDCPVLNEEVLRSSNIFQCSRKADCFMPNECEF